MIRSAFFVINSVLAAAFFATVFTVYGQAPAAGKGTVRAGSGERFPAAVALAQKALEAHGGEKLRAMRTLVVNGSVDVTTSAVAQAIPASFITIFSGEKYRIEIANPIQPFKQVFDGVNTSTTIRGGFTLPPVNRLGFPLLPKIGLSGFVITPLPEGKKKRAGFRMTSPEGYYTDFYLDEKTNLLRGYDSSYTINGRTVTTAVEIDKYRLVEGVNVPERYVQRFDSEQVIVYANFKAKEIKVNTPVADEVFNLGS